MRSGTRRRTASTRNGARSREAWTNTTARVEQRAVELPSGYQNAWVNRGGEYLVTDREGFNPNVELEGSWTKLERRE